MGAFLFLSHALTIILCPLLIFSATLCLHLGITLVTASMLTYRVTYQLPQIFYFFSELKLIYWGLLALLIGILCLKLSMFLYHRIMLSFSALFQPALSVLAFLVFILFLYFRSCLYASEDAALASSRNVVHGIRGWDTLSM